MANHILKHEHKALKILMNKLGELKKLNQLLAQYEPEIAKHCHIIKFEQNCLFVMVDNGSWTTQLRFQIPNLIRKLSQNSHLENLSGIICKTRPPHIPSSSSKAHTRLASGLTPKTAASILEAASKIQDVKLKAIMEKIAQNVK